MSGSKRYGRIPRLWLRPWRIHGARVDLRFEPFHERADRTNLGVVANQTHQCFGHWSGRVRADGEWLRIADVFGWAEDVHNRW